MEYIGDYTATNRPYFTLPVFATHLDLSHSALVLYARIYTRCMLSRKNGIFDSENHAYCFYPVENMAKDMRCSERTIHTLLRELERFDLIERRRMGGGANHIYAKYAFFAYGEKISDEERAALMIEASEGKYSDVQ
ncbi:MAG: replication initiator protein A [Clostridia bacterium]|nr:replication initiator protein A [Clostridia bacterium]